MHPISLYFILVFPLIVFFIVDAFVDFKTAGISAIFVAIMCAFIELLIFKTISVPIALSTFLFLLCGVLSLLKEKPFYFKIEPAIFSLVMGLILLVASLVGGSFFAGLVPKYLHVMLKEPKVLSIFVHLARIISWFLIVRAILIALASKFKGNWQYVFTIFVSDCLISFICLFKIMRL